MGEPVPSFPAPDERTAARRSRLGALLRSDGVAFGTPLDRPAHRAATARRLHRIGLALAWCSTLMGAAVLAGYAVRSRAVVQVSPGLPPMYPNAALALVAGGVAVAGAQRRGAGRAVAVLAVATVTGIGAVSLTLDVAGARRTWFEGLFPSGFVTPTSPVAGRPAAETCIALVLLGSSLALWMLRRRTVLSQALAFAGTAVGLTATVGYALGVDRRALGGGGLYVGMALHTAVAITTLGLGAVLVRPPAGIVAQLLDGGATGAMSRRLTAVIAGVPLALVLTGSAISRTFGDRELAQSVFSVVQVGVLGAAVLVPSAVIARTERQLQERLDESRRRDEDVTDIDTMVESITAELMVTTPAVRGWDVGVRYEPAWGHLAGDSLQVLEAPDEGASTLVAVFDIAGHDAHAALLAYGLRAHISALWECGVGIGEIAASANRKLVRRRTIASAVLARFGDGGTVEILNAGHPPPLRLHRGEPSWWTATGPLLGIRGATYGVRTEPVEVGDVVVVHTDGIDEARAPDRRRLGEHRLTDLARAWADEPPQRIADGFVDAALDHAGGRLGDDAMVVVLRRQA